MSIPFKIALIALIIMVLGIIITRYDMMPNSTPGPIGHGKLLPGDIIELIMILGGGVVTVVAIIWGIIIL